MIAEITCKRNGRRISHRISEPQGGKARSFALRACFVVHDMTCLIKVSMLLLEDRRGRLTTESLDER
jgi:hypothetical protein